MTRISAEPHRTSKLLDPDEVSQLEDHRLRRVVVEFGRVGSFDPADVSRKLDRSALHAETDSKIGSLLAASVVDRPQHPEYAAFSKSSGHQNRVEIPQPIFPVRILDKIFRLDPSNLYSQPV